MKRLFRQLAKDLRGATAIEYGLIIAGIALTIFAAFSLFAGNGTSIFNGAMDTTSATLEASRSGN